MSYLDEVFGLQGKTAIVTGGGQGIGQVVAVGLAKAGAEIVVVCRHGADETIRLIEEVGGKAYYEQCDVTKEDQVDKCVASIVARSGKIDILFNNAGVCYHKGIFEATIEDWREVIDINLTGEYIMARAVIRTMIDKGIQGSIVNMASMSGTIVNIPQWQAAYNASKAGIIHLTKSLAIEMAHNGYDIRVNALSPGYVATPMSIDPDFVEPELIENWTRLMPTGRMAKPEELVPAVLYMVSPVAGYTNGADTIVDGAYSVQ